VTKSRKQAGQKPGPDTIRFTALTTRVSTLRQAANDEGSLKNQLQRLRAHIQYKKSTCGEDWREAGIYELRGVSGKNSVRSPELQRLYNDIRAGRVNAVLVTALDRVCPNVSDFLAFFEFLNEHGVEFISLREQFDTTSPQVKLQVTMLMALAEFEREITSQRTSEAMADRADRGLWNGGRILGYDSDPNRKGSLVPNPDEAAVVTVAFDTYLTTGSLTETADELNRRGYRTKAYNSRRELYHPGHEFSKTTLQYLLQNPAYIGKKVVNKRSEGNRIEKGEGYRLVDAVWETIISQEKFDAVQRLMTDNGQTHRSGASSIQHVYSLSVLVHCKRCDSRMDGESATGRTGKKYFYYRCGKKECGMRVAAQEVEEAIVGQLELLAEDPDLLDQLTAETNRKLQQGKPGLERQCAKLEKDLREVMAMADKLLMGRVEMEQHTAQDFIREKLNALGQHRIDLEHGLAQVHQELESLDREAVDADLVRATLGQMKGVFETLKPYEQRELMQLVLQRAEVNEREITLEVYALTEAALPGKVGAEGEVVRTRPGWLPAWGENPNFFQLQYPGSHEVLHQTEPRERLPLPGLWAFTACSR
jgi:site-specific DNA recombinase